MSVIFDHHLHQSGFASGFGAGGSPVRKADLAFSAATLGEMVSVLERELFDHYLTRGDRQQFLEALGPVAGSSKSPAR